MLSPFHRPGLRSAARWEGGDISLCARSALADRIWSAFHHALPPEAKIKMCFLAVYQPGPALNSVRLPLPYLSVPQGVSRGGTPPCRWHFPFLHSLEDQYHLERAGPARCHTPPCIKGHNKWSRGPVTGDGQVDPQWE